MGPCRPGPSFRSCSSPVSHVTEVIAPRPYPRLGPILHDPPRARLMVRFVSTAEALRRRVALARTWLVQPPCPFPEPNARLSDRLFDLDPMVEEEHAQRLADTDMAGPVSLDGRPGDLAAHPQVVVDAGRLFSRGQTRRNLWLCLALRSAVRDPTLLWCFAPSAAVRRTRDGRSSNAGPGGRTAAAVCCPSARNVQSVSSGIGFASAVRASPLDASAVTR